MESQKTLKFYEYVDGVNDRPFPSAEDQIEVGAFRYDAKRMGGAPTLTTTVNYGSCLDNEWNWGVYVEFKGEKYYLKSTPTSSYSLNDARYIHTVELVSERKQLEDIYFYDAVVGVPQENDKPVTNDTNFHFYGNIADFVKRMNASLQYASLQTEKEDGTIEGYHVVIDEGITTADKHLSFDGAVFAQALQECYNTFAIPFYFVGKEIHVGFTNNAISEVLEYGVDDALLSVTRNNSNFKIVNRATGKGSTDNIPYYYPNNAPKGEIEAVVNTTSDDFEVSIADYEVFGQKIKIDDTIEYVNNLKAGYDTEDITWSKNFNFSSNKQTYSFVAHYGIKDVDYNRTKKLQINPTVYLEFYKDVFFDQDDNTYWDWVAQPLSEVNAKIIISIDDEEVYNMPYSPQGMSSFEVLLDKKEEDVIKVKITFEVSQELIEGEGIYYYDNCLYKGQLGLTYNISFDEEVESRWIYNDKGVDLEDFGLSYKGTPNVGDTITQRLVKKVNTATNLQPSIYRATDGKERFYNAINYPFDYVEGYELQYGEYIGEGGKVHNDLYKKDDGTYMVFVNPYVEGNPKEHVFSVDELKPTIEEMTNGVYWQDTDENGDTVNVYQRIDMFAEFAYDEGDNDETYTTEDGQTAYKHPYFFAKLRKLDFNLFEHASERQEMTFSMTSGNCGACNFLIGVSDDDLQLNPVQVDENGNLVRDEEGRVLCGLEDYQPLVQPQDEQQDTINNEVWIALKKEDSTYGILMPKAPKYDGDTLVEAGHRPRACSSATSNDGDTFVIIGINLPEEYILHAERKLEKKIIQYIGENNDEKFNFSIGFSRIYLEENPDILSQLNENARLTIRYNNAEYLLYVSSYSYNMSEGDVLPEIRVELDDTLTIAQNALQRAIDSVKIEVGQKINALDVAGIGSRYFLRKDTTDVAEELIGFRKGVLFGDSSDVYVNPKDGTAKLTIDYLDVRRKATFTSLEIQEKTHVGGQFLVTPAAMTCSYVEELDNAYRCYFQTAGEGGEEIFNTFAMDDQAICQTYSAWGSKFYWRLVVGVGDNYIDLSKTDCAPESDVPAIGDKIIQLGNRSNIARQAAQVLSSYGEDSPSFIMYNGIDSFSLEGKNITGIIWNPETQEPQMYSYGSFFFGDKKLEGNYITFQKKDGDTEKTLTINADVQLGSNSTGLSNLSEWKAQDKKVTQAANDASTAKATATEAKTAADTANANALDAQNMATEASQRLNEWASDGIISPVEKQALKNELATVRADYSDIELQYQKYIQEFDTFILTDGKYYVTEDGYVFNVETANANWSAFNTAYDDYVAVLNSKINAEGSVEVGDLSTKQAEYYGARTAMLEDISLSIKAEADYSKQTAQEAKETANLVDAATKTLDTKISDIETGVNESVAEINARLDGVVENYFEEGVPTTSNYPASEWTTEEEKANHVGDTYTNISSYDEDPNNAGKSWRWTYTDTEHTGYHWHPIADSDAVKALLEASKAQATADGKSRNFVSQPVPPYSVGDLWIQGPDGDTMRCITTRETGSYTASDWELASKYTDDTVANEAMSEANAAKTKLNEWASDNVISPLEKESLRTELAFILGDYNDIEKNYIKYIQEFDTLILQDGNQYITVDGFVFNVESANTNWQAFENAYLAYKSDLEAKTATNDTVAIGTLKETQTEYYNKRALVLEDITLAIKAEADYATEQSRAAKKEAEEAKAEIADYEYLKNALGKSLAVEGVVMSQMVAVADVKNAEDVTEANVKAFLNGSDFAGSGDNKLILAAGIPQDERDLEERAKEAVVRIYEDGTLRASAARITGEVYAEGGRIGPLNIFEHGLSMLDYPDNAATGDIYPAIAMFITTMSFSLQRMTSSSQSVSISNVNIPLGDTLGPSFSVSRNNNYMNQNYAAIEVDCYGGDESNAMAFRAINGMFAGLRPKMRTITSGETLSKLDHSVMVICPTSMTITLPKDPEIGQEYELYMISTESAAHRLTIDGNGTGIQNPVGGTWGHSTLEANPYGVIRLVCAYDQHGTKLWWFYRLR